jgi:hypothetical protein
LNISGISSDVVRAPAAIPIPSASILGKEAVDAIRQCLGRLVGNVESSTEERHDIKGKHKLASLKPFGMDHAVMQVLALVL